MTPIGIKIISIVPPCLKIQDKRVIPYQPVARGDMDEREGEGGGGGRGQAAQGRRGRLRGSFYSF